MKCNMVYGAVVVVVALLLAILACVLPADRLQVLIVVSRFFDAMIPVLAVGALIKYVSGCSVCVNCKSNNK